jgi:uncharacterized protein YbjQ (UPF0145 family)
MENQNQAQPQERPLGPIVPREMTSTTFDPPGYGVVRNMGMVRGITVRSPNLGKQITGAFRTFAGGEIHEYVEVAEQSRERAYLRMLEHAAMIGANAVLGVRYDATEIWLSVIESLFGVKRSLR